MNKKKQQQDPQLQTECLIQGAFKIKFDLDCFNLIRMCVLN